MNRDSIWFSLRSKKFRTHMLLANAGLLLGGLFWGWLAAIAGLHLTFHIATLAIMFSMPLCLIWSLDPVDRMWRLAVHESGCNRVDLVGRASNQVRSSPYKTGRRRVDSTQSI
jgi:hypothetical protein